MLVGAAVLGVFEGSRAMNLTLYRAHMAMSAAHRKPCTASASTGESSSSNANGSDQESSLTPARPGRTRIKSAKPRTGSPRSTSS